MKTYKYTIVMPPKKGEKETKQTNSELVVKSALKKRYLVIDNSTEEEILEL